jgi:hypothetical protein
MLTRINIFVYQNQHAPFSKLNSLGNSITFFRHPPVRNWRKRRNLNGQCYRFAPNKNPLKKIKAKKINISFLADRQWLATFKTNLSYRNALQESGHRQ